MSNPVMNTVYSDRAELRRLDLTHDTALTKSDIFSATAICLGIVSIVAIIQVYIGLNISAALVSMAALGGIGGIIVLGIMMIASPKARRGSPILAGLMSVCQGLMAGGITFAVGAFEVGGAPGWNLVMQALIGTTILFFVALFLYTSGTIKVTQKFTTFLVFACSAMALGYLVNLGVSLITGTNYLWSDGPIPIIIGVVAIILGTMTLIQDFSSIDSMIQSGSESRVKWALATSIVVSLVWLYVEILRVLYLLRN